MDAPQLATAGTAPCLSLHLPCQAAEDTGVRLKAGSEVQRGRVRDFAATCGRLITSIAQPNNWRLGKKAPEFSGCCGAKGASRPRLLASSSPGNPSPIKYKCDSFLTLYKM